MADTSSLQKVFEALRTRLLAFPNVAGQKASDILGTRLYFGAPPANSVYPFGVMSFNLRSSKAYGGERMKGTMELLLIARPADATYAQSLELCADLLQGAVLFYRDGNSAAATSGLIFVVDGDRANLPAPAEPVDQQTYSIRLSWDVVVWPRFLTQYAHP